MNNLRYNLQAFLNLVACYRDEGAAIYDAIAPGYDAFAAPWDELLAKPALDRLYEIVAQRLPRGGRILDAGCGTGERIRHLLKVTEAGEIVGLDCSPKMLEMAQRKIPDKRVRFVQGDVRQLPFADNTFDAVISTWVLEFFSDPRSIVEEFVRVINETGFVSYSFITVPRNSRQEMDDEFGRHLLSVSDQASFYLRASRRPFHHCRRSSLDLFHGGLLSVATLAKCCQVGKRGLPCRDDGKTTPAALRHRPCIRRRLTADNRAK